MRKLIGPILILLGIYLFVNRGETLEVGSLISYFWPSMFILPLALFFHWMYFIMLNRKGTGLLIPGGLIGTVGIVCQIATLMDNWQYMWPGFILAPAVGLFEFYWFGNRNKWLLVPIYILTGLALVFTTVYTAGSLYNHFILAKPMVAIVLIVTGLLFMLQYRRKTA